MWLVLFVYLSHLNITSKLTLGLKESRNSHKSIEIEPETELHDVQSKDVESIIPDYIEYRCSGKDHQCFDILTNFFLTSDDAAKNIENMMTTFSQMKTGVFVTQPHGMFHWNHSQENFNSQQDSDSNPCSDPKTDPESASDSGSGSNLGSDSGFDTDSDSKSDTYTDTDTDTETDLESDSEIPAGQQNRPFPGRKKIFPDKPWRFEYHFPYL